MLAGIPVRDQDVLELALLLRKAGIDGTAETLEKAYDLESARPDHRRPGGDSSRAR